ncbi:copper amine oxidase N-terminal domain-containing protein [Metallumcola ferriviriculae]|uniref:Copper amine oxidase N-terminal domain-containing protein n=1 Tax=Metallumcola ferriviriculae TaxID=3039180 RepID=A0AAU0UUZ0_9FIRM|nr:copper amine oxidase N-terminal domain-containing protein [Desulfitibacteraceae bacterium MK1]
MRKHFVFVNVMIFALLTFISPAYAGMDNSVHIVVDTHFLNTDVKPRIENGRTLVPLRAIAEELDFKVHWETSTQTIHIWKDSVDISLGIDKKIALINSKKMELDVPPKIISGRTLVPLRFVSEALGRNVHYTKLNNYTPMIYITEYDLLDDEDVKVPNDNFIKKQSDPYEPPVYVLKQNSETRRNIKLGDTVENVQRQYGVPLRSSIDENGNGNLIYTTAFIPETDSGLRMVLKFTNGVLAEVAIPLM